MSSLLNKRAVVLLSVLLYLIPILALSAQERRSALVIGNSDYKSSPLRNPVNDATDVAAALNKLGFNVILKTNVNQRAMEESIRDFGKALRKGGVGLFFYAGHGFQSKGRNYLIPIDADIRSEADVKYEAVDAGRVLAQMEEAENGLNIVILDACRDNPFARSFRSTNKGLAKMDAPTGSILAYSTAPGSVAADGTDTNGLYTSMLLKHIMTPGLEIGKLFRLVRIDVVKASNETQIPWESSSLMGDFYFSQNRGINVEGRTASDKENHVKETPKYATLHPDNNMPFKVAVFPWKFERNEGRYNVYLYTNLIVNNIFKSFNDVNLNGDLDLFDIQLSYYDPPQKRRIRTIDPGLFDNISIIPANSSNLEKICELGKSLGVDTIVTGVFIVDVVSYNRNVKTGTTKFYLVDVKTKKLFSGVCNYDYFFGTGYGSEMYSLMSKVIKDYQASILPQKK